MLIGWKNSNAGPETISQWKINYLKTTLLRLIYFWMKHPTMKNNLNMTMLGSCWRVPAWEERISSQNLVTEKAGLKIQHEGCLRWGLRGYQRATCSSLMQLRVTLLISHSDWTQWKTSIFSFPLDNSHTSLQRISAVLTVSSVHTSSVNWVQQGNIKFSAYFEL